MSNAQKSLSNVKEDIKSKSLLLQYLFTSLKSVSQKFSFCGNNMGGKTGFKFPDPDEEISRISINIDQHDQSNFYSTSDKSSLIGTHINNIAVEGDKADQLDSPSFCINKNKKFEETSCNSFFMSEECKKALEQGLRLSKDIEMLADCSEDISQETMFNERKIAQKSTKIQKLKEELKRSEKIRHDMMIKNEVMKQTMTKMEESYKKTFDSLLREKKNRDTDDIITKYNNLKFDYKNLKNEKKRLIETINELRSRNEKYHAKLTHMTIANSSKKSKREMSRDNQLKEKKIASISQKMIKPKMVLNLKAKISKTNLGKSISFIQTKTSVIEKSVDKQNKGSKTRQNSREKSKQINTWSQKKESSEQENDQNGINIFKTDLDETQDFNLNLQKITSETDSVDSYNDYLNSLISKKPVLKKKSSKTYELDQKAIEMKLSTEFLKHKAKLSRIPHGSKFNNTRTLNRSSRNINLLTESAIELNNKHLDMNVRSTKEFSYLRRKKKDRESSD